MGIWESLQWMAEAGRRGLADPAAGGAVGTAAGTALGAATAIVGTGQAVGAAAGVAIGGAGQVMGTAAEKVVVGASEGARRVQGAMPDREGWETISRIAWQITDHALAEFTRPYTGGIPVYRYLREELAKGGADNKEEKDRKQGVAGSMKTTKGAEKPEDVIEDFRTSGFRGGGFINRNKSPPN